MGPQHMDICVLIPVLNESRTIGKIVSSLSKMNIPVLVVDDGSTDKSGEIAKKNGAEIIRHEQRAGKGISLQDGLQKAMQRGFDGVIMMDGDAQHATEDIQTFLDESVRYDDVVITGNRMNDSKEMPLIRLMTNYAMSLLISMVCKQKIPDTQCGFRYISKGIIKRLKLKSKEFEIETEMLIQSSRLGYKIHSIPVKTIYSDEKSHIHPVIDTIRFIIYILKEIIAPKL